MPILVLQIRKVIRHLVSALKLYHYKSYAEGAFAFFGDLNFVVGRNGIGKTNLLDAIYYLCMARSHSTPQDRDTVQFGKSFFRIEAEIIVSGEAHAVCVKVKPGAVKEITVDGKQADKLSAYVGFLPVVMLAPEDVVLIRGGSAGRRRFLDLFVSQADKTYLEHLQRYQRLLAQRNALLRNEGFRSDRTLLMMYSESMQESAAYLRRVRAQFIDGLLPEVMSIYAMLSSAAECPALEYHSHLTDHTLVDLASESIEADIKAGYTTKGIHKDDLEILLDGKPAKRFGSEGQVKSLLIALHLGQTHVLRQHTGKSPILLLDDIFDRLDEYRARGLIEVLSQLSSGQVFISDASPNQMRRLIALSGLDARILELPLDNVLSPVRDENDNLQDNDDEEE